MNTMLLTVALLAAPLIAQTTPPADPAAQTTPADPATAPAPSDQTTPPDSATTSAPADQAAPADPATPADPAMAAPADPAGPPAAPMTAPAAAGNVTFGSPVVTPPTPAPAEYPMCSKTVKDSCRNRGGR